MMYFAVPLSPESQIFQLTMEGVEYQLRVLYRHMGGGWVHDIAEASGAPVVSGIPLVTGVDLLAQYRYLGISGSLWVQGANNPDDPPTYDNLGSGARVFWVTD